MARQRMVLDSQRELMQKNWQKNMKYRMEHEGDTIDLKPVLKLFNPCGAATWLLTELDEDGDTAFGLCDLGQQCPELGYVSLEELASVTLPFGLYIERDIHFRAHKTLSEYAAKARELGRIEIC